MLRIEHFTKRYGDKVAVNNLNLHIAPGEIYGFIGHNGAGKTTTLKACCGLLRFTEGTILINGKSIREEPLSCKREIAYIPDNPDLYDFLTGYDFLNFVADVYGVSKKERTERIDTYGEMLGITEALTLPISEYSHGMKQKVAIISALVHAPKLILMDEPFVGLDPSASHQLKQLMTKHCEEGGAIFFSTHVLEV
ncbi:MAG: ABC transporter ATP-binding protein, partial [Lachnospiraceae bacterium]